MIRRLALLVILLAVPSLAAAQGYGPQASITCPVGAVDIWPGVDINLVVVANPGNTAFCLRAGVHPITYATTPKTGDAFTCEYGAILDGSNWSTTDDIAAAFRAHNQDIDSVTIRNCAIRNMPKRGIQAYAGGSCAGVATANTLQCVFSSAGADHWTIDHNEIGHVGTYGFIPPSDSTISANYVHDCGLACYSGYLAERVLVDSNEITHGGPYQKMVYTRSVTFRNNYIHDTPVGIWFDGENTGVLIEGNRVEDVSGSAIFYEVSGQGVIRNNVVRRSGEGVLVSTSHSVEMYGNVLEDNYRGINYLTDITRVGLPEGGAIGEEFYMRDVSAHDNSIRVPTTPYAYASLLNPLNGDATPYINGSLNLTFAHNAYSAPGATGGFWYVAGANDTFAQWQALSQDVTGTLNGTGAPPTPTTEPPPPSPDTLAPTVTLKPPTRSGKSSNYSVTTTATDNVGVTSFALSLDGQVFANQPGTYTVKITAAGPHTFKAEAKDGAGNLSSTTATVTR